MTQRTNEEQTKMGEAGRSLRFREPHGQPAQQSSHLQGQGELIQTQYGHGDYPAGPGTGTTPHPCRQQQTPARLLRTLLLHWQEETRSQTTQTGGHFSLTSLSYLRGHMVRKSKSLPAASAPVPRCECKGLTGLSWLRGQEALQGLAKPRPAASCGLYSIFLAHLTFTAKILRVPVAWRLRPVHVSGRSGANRSKQERSSDSGPRGRGRGSATSLKSTWQRTAAATPTKGTAGPALGTSGNKICSGNVSTHKRVMLDGLHKSF